MSPRVGVVVPCKDEIATLAHCLQALRAQRPPVEKIIVIDNGSTDGSREVAQTLADQVVDLPPGATIAGMRNTGAALLGDAGVDVLGFVDSDCVVAADWLQIGLDGLATHDMVGSRTLAQQGAPWVAARWAAIEKVTAHGDSHLWTQHLLVKREVFEALNGFDETLRTGEDIDFSDRLRRAGHSLALREDMVVRHHGFPPTLRSFIRREVWHTSTPGWFDRMSPKSRLLVQLTAGWLLLGAVVAGSSVLGNRPRRLGTWLASSALALPALGSFVGKSRRHVIQDGTLIGIWSLVRVGRLWRELAHSRAGDER